MKKEKDRRKDRTEKKKIPISDIVVIAIILSVIGAFGFDLWLASTQWVIISGVLGIYAIYLKIRE